MSRRITGPLAAAILLTAALAALTHGMAWQTERNHPPIGRFVEVDGIRLHYTERGSGPPLLLVHGASSTLLEFESSITPVLAQDFRVIAFDRPGFGYSERPEGPWRTPPELADLLLRASASLGAERPVIVGHSWAGAVVMGALQHAPDRIAGGVLLAGVSGHWAREGDLAEELRERPWLNRMFAHTALYPAGQAMLPAALAGVFAPHPVPEGHAQRIGADLALRPGSYLANSEDMRHLSPFLQRESPAYAGISAPVLAIHGGDDEVVPFWNHGGRLGHVLPQLEVHLMPGQGHALHQVDPEGVAAAIAAFARRLTPVAAGAPAASPPAPGSSAPPAGA